MKMNKKILIKLFFMLIIIYLTISNTTIVMAKKTETKGTSGISLSNMEAQANKFLSTGANQAGDIDTTAIAQNFVGLGQILTMVGAGVLVAVTTYMGIKYLTAGPEAQAKLKVQLIGIVVSGVVIFGAYGIWQLVVDIASQF